jgi:hypothetical protein
VRPTVRTLALERLFGCAAAAAVAAWALGGEHAGRTILVAQCAAVALCVGAAAAAEDPGADTTAAVPPPLRFRLALRLAIGALAVAVAWGAVLWLAGIGSQCATVLTLQLLALAALTWALAATLPHGAAVAGPAVALAFLVARLGLPAWDVRREPRVGLGAPAVDRPPGRRHRRPLRGDARPLRHRRTYAGRSIAAREA